jgi:hypothetical protein
MENLKNQARDYDLTEMRKLLAAYYQFAIQTDSYFPKTEKGRKERKKHIRSALRLPESRVIQEKFEVIKVDLSKIFSHISVSWPDFPVIDTFSYEEMPPGMHIVCNPPELRIEVELLRTAHPDMILSIIIHELYHWWYQNLTLDMEHIKHVRDRFGILFEGYMDIEADVQSYIMLC